jgi:phospholipase/carboxylesterase
MDTSLSFVHRYQPAARVGSPPLLLLHGTGGDEDDLLPIGRMVSPGSALLSPRGQVLENGMPRFFRRLAEGVFDQADVVRRAHELADFVEAARKSYAIAAPVALGYSNGANIAAAVLLLRPEALAGAVLLRAMVPLTDTPRAQLASKPVLLLSGAMDPIAPPENAARLASLLRKAGAAVEQRTLPVGHELSQADIATARTWLEKASVLPLAAVGQPGSP